VKFKDTQGNAVSTHSARDRARIAEHLTNASHSVSDPAHEVHAHIAKAASVLGLIRDRSEDESSDKGNLTSPGERSRFPSRVGQDTTSIAEGSSQVASRAQSPLSLAKARRDATVVHLYKIAARQTDKRKATKIETLARELDAISDADLLKKFGSGIQFIGGGGHRSFAERHAAPY
jgi:hypothetical protein